MKRFFGGSRVALATIAITASTLAPGGSMAGAAAAADKLAACYVRTLPVDGRVLLLGIHADSHLVDYLFAAEVGRAGGRRLVDYSTGARVDAPPVHSIHASEPLLSPTGRWVAHAKTEQGQSSLVVERIDGSDAKTCLSSDGFLRALAFSMDERSLVMMSARGNEHRLILCDMQRGLIHSWSTTTLGEQAREPLRPRLHGRPPWMIDFARFSPDATKILSGRIDGQLVLWDVGGNRRQTTTVANYSPGSMRTRFGFDTDAGVYQLARDVDPAKPRPTFVVSRLFPEQARLAVVHDAGIKARRSLEFPEFHVTAQGLMLLYLMPSAVTVAAVPGGETIAQVPANESVLAVAISSDGAMVAIAHPERINVWRLVPPGSCQAGTSSKPG